MANKKPKIRTETVGVRLPPKLRYGLVLVARKNGLTLSEAMMRALETYLENDGIGAKPKEQGAMLSRLDRLWSESPAQRLLLLTEQAPELATRHELLFAEVLRESGMTVGLEADQFLEVMEEHKKKAFDSPEVMTSQEMHEHLAGLIVLQFPRLKNKFSDERQFLEWIRGKFE